MQQEIKDGTAELLQPKKDINQSEQNNEEKHLNSSKPENGSAINSQLIQIKEEIDVGLTQLEIINQSPDQTKDDVNSVSKQSEKEEGNVNHGQTTEETNMSDQPKENETIINNEPETNITNELEKIVNKKLQAIINNNESVQIVDVINSNTEQPANEINSNLQQSQEDETNNQSNQNEEETHCILPQSEQQVLSSEQDQTAKELNYNSEQPEKEIADNPDQVQEELDYSAEADLDFGDNNSEFEIIDIADYDPEFPTEDVNESPSVAKETVEETTNDATKKATDETKTNKPESKKKLTDAQKRKVLKNLERQIVLNKLNPNNLPPRIWRSLKQLSGAQRKKFLRTMRDKFAKKQFSGQTASNRSPQMQGETGPFNDMIKQGVINDLTNSLSSWLLEHWAAMDVNTEGNTTARNTLNEAANEISFSDGQKRRFMRNVERMIDRNMVDLHNLPPRIWNSMKQLRSNERNKFLKAMKEKLARQSGIGQSQAAGTSKSLRSPSNTTNNRNFGESDRLPSSSTGSKNKAKKPSARSSSYSFDRDFQNQRLNERDSANISTTTKVSPNIFSHYFQDGYSQARSTGKSTMDRNTFDDYTEPPYHSFNDSYQTPNREGTAFRSSSNLFSYDNQRYMEGANRPSYSDRGNYQSQSRYNDGGMNFQSNNSGNTPRTMEKSPYGSSYTTDFRMQAGLSQGAVNLHQDMYSSIRDTLKRKLSHSMTPYGQPQPKRSNTSPNKSFSNANDDSIRAVVTDDSNPRGTMNEEQASLLTAELVRLLDAFSLSAQGHIPRFYNSGLSSGGVFRITCADQTSFDWLKQMVSDLPQLWKGSKLHVGNFTNLSTKRVRVNVFIPGPLEESAMTLQRLERQNPGINTAAWKVFRQSGNSRGQVLFLEIDEPSIQVLKKMDFKAFLGLSCITFQLAENQKNKKAKRR